MLSQENLMTHSIKDGSIIVSFDDFTIDNLNVFFVGYSLFSSRYNTAIIIKQNSKIGRCDKQTLIICRVAESNKLNIIP